MTSRPAPIELAEAAAALCGLASAPDFPAAVAVRAGLAPAAAAERVADVVSEARLAVALLGRPPAAPLTSATRVLEVGAGAGLVAAILHRAGVRVTALEPLLDGFDVFAAIRAELAARAPDDAPALDRRAAAALDPRRDGAFDLIFSINVLEHCRPLDATLDALAAVLAPGGRMIHACPNYRVPYEPHFALPLLPGAPALTARLLPRLAADPLWRSLNFITARDVLRFARRSGLRCRLEPGVLAGAVARLGRDPAFARRQGWAGRLAAGLARSGALAWLSWLPPSWQTPMVVVLERPG